MKYLAVLLLLLFALSAGADFHAPDKPSLDFNGSGIQRFGNWTASGAVPLKFIDGYVGVRYLKDGIPDDETAHTHLRARIEGGHQWGRLALRAYGRYGQESAMLQKGLYHGGFNVEVDLLQRNDSRLILGVGTWAERHDLLDAYLEDSVSEEGIDFGLRAHLTLKDKHWTVNCAVLPHSDKTYQVRSFVDIQIPLFKLAFIEQVFLAVSGNVEYYSQTRHVSIDALQWRWSHGLSVKF